MIIKNKKQALRSYIETIEKICRGLKKEELVDLVVKIAGEETPEMRSGFLDKIKKHLPGDGTSEKSVKLLDEQLSLEKLQCLKESIMERIASIENYTYWDEPDDDWEDEYYSDDDPDYLDNFQKIELAAVFDIAGDYFLQNKLPESKRLYKQIFALIAEIEGYGLMPDIEVDILEAHARYCRAVYELSGKEQRVEEMLAVMAVTELGYDFDNLKGNDLALFQDVIDAQVGELPDMKNFLIQWSLALSKMGHNNERLARLRLEAAQLNEGLDGVRKLAQSWKAKQPIGYLYWMECLANADHWQELAEASQEALNKLKNSPERRRAARFLVQAGQQIRNDDLVLEGRREAFRSSLSEYDLLFLMDEANRRQTREKEIANSLEVLLQRKDGVHRANRLLAKLLLMAGDIQGLAKLCKSEKVYGWSGGSPGALLFCAVLYCISSKGSKKCVLIESMLADYSEGSMYFDSYCLDDEEPITTFAAEIKKGLTGVDITKKTFTKHIPPTLQNGEKRVEYIVSNKYRNAYERAACVLAAMVEMYIARGEKQQANELFHKYYSQLYNRFPAFKSEVRKVMEKTPLLVGVKIMLYK